MDISIQHITIKGKEVWQVESCGVTVAFHEKSQAMTFAEKLQNRVDAPHVLPEDILQRWEAEQAKWLSEEKT